MLADIGVLVGHAAGWAIDAAPGRTSTAVGAATGDPRSTRVVATASCTHPPSRDAAGNLTSYEPQRAVDGLSDTAWRCAGDGVGQSLKLTFTSPVRLRTIGIVPGLAKTDPADGTDRYAQNRRISRVRFTFDNGATAELSTDTSPSDRQMQNLTLDGDGVTTRTLTITILSSVPGSAQNGHAALDTVAISEVGLG
ncbi:NADase-type glycan-binding domain-containing protein [Pseudonocardia acidicola]